MLQKVTRLDSVPTAEETVLTTEVPTKESRLYTLLDLGAMNVQQGYKSSFMILHGHSRLDRPNEKFYWVYVRLPTHPPSWFEKCLVM